MGGGVWTNTFLGVIICVKPFIGSKVMAILLNGRIWPIGGIALGRVWLPGLFSLLTTVKVTLARLLYGKLSYLCTVLTAYMYNCIYIAAMTSLSSFAIIKTLYIFFFERMNDISDVSIVRTVRGFTLGIAVTAAATEATVKVRLSGLWSGPC